MKTKSTFAGLLVGLLGLLFLLPSAAKAQNGGCSLIGNDINCTVKVQIDVYKNNGLNCNALCISYNTSIPPFSSINVNCPCTACLVVVTILDVNGTPASGGTDSNTSGPQSITSTPCAGSTIEYSNYAVGGVFKIKP